MHVLCITMCYALYMYQVLTYSLDIELCLSVDLIHALALANIGLIPLLYIQHVRQLYLNVYGNTFYSIALLISQMYVM